MFYIGYRKICDFIKFKTKRAFGDDVKNNVMTMDMSNDEQIKLAQKIRECNSYTKTRNNNMTKEKSDILNNAKKLLKGKKWFIMILSHYHINE